ncbi:MAG: cytochrome c family protein [Beijerinckiaceae bacterium]|nr:cytochrome c family protein [Beijerinckiaceae bacterium]
MDSFELNKIAGALLGSLLLAMSLNIITGEIYSRPKPVKPGYVLPMEPEPASASDAAAAVLPIERRLAAADEKKGQSGAKACIACHSFNKGAAAKSGPPLYGVAGRAIGASEGFEYSEAIKSKGGTWTYADLDLFLANPKAYAEGTKMTYAGEADPSKRADIIAYLRSLSDNPEPLPEK